MQLFGLADCNNFFCSCERVFHPELHDKPVVVLSNNDGCIIARSEESKQLGLKMGTPLYQARNIIEANHVAVFSSNYTLYGSLSNRVMSLLARHTPQLTQYSIDEAFLDFSERADIDQMKVYGEQMVAVIKKSTGIPISLGIASTKTLAKIASKYAKKHVGYKGCCIIDTEEKREKALAKFEVSDVWGIGRHLRKTLDYYSIYTAADFAQKSESWIKSKFNVSVLRTWKELHGISCIDIEELPEKKTICTSRSFADQGITELPILEEAVANFAAAGADKLRRQKSCCQGITIFAYTSRFRTDQPQHVIHQSVTLPIATQSSSEIIGWAVKLLRTNFPSNRLFAFKKAGVILWNIIPEQQVQQDLFDPIDRQKQASLMKAIDAINRKNGHNKIRVAVQGTNIRYGLKREYLSKQYTTNINDIIVAKAE